MKSPSLFTLSLAGVAGLVILAAAIASPQAYIVCCLLALIPTALAWHYSLPVEPGPEVEGPAWFDVRVRFHSSDPRAIVDHLVLQGWEVIVPTDRLPLKWLTVRVAVPATSEVHAARVLERVMFSGTYTAAFELDSIAVMPDRLPRQLQDRLVPAA